MDEIITGKHIARRDGAKTHRDWISTRCEILRRHNRLDTPFTGLIAGPEAQVHARIDFGRWISDCPDCGGAEYVDPDEQIFYCMSCGNRAIGGKARPVVFPDAKIRQEIEHLVLERPVDDRRGATRIERALLSRPIFPGLARSWNPHESADDLRGQNRKAR